MSSSLSQYLSQSQINILDFFFSFLEKMSCCGGNCSCGSDCKCDGCKGCKMYPDLGFSGETTTTQTLVLGVAPSMNSQYEASGETFFAENDGCKCGSDCKCDNPCTCK
ncbi:hypothetical protein BRARA_B00047 [Brassica rapa]|nr:hypothetical protein IGI04_004304 [Brassica rapa subsp. trilocularis]RID72868.1 hypothetical protein BRARA_B00047 [Brassica rapa]